MPPVGTTLEQRDWRPAETTRLVAARKRADSTLVVEEGVGVVGELQKMN